MHVLHEGKCFILKVISEFYCLKRIHCWFILVHQMGLNKISAELKSRQLLASGLSDTVRVHVHVCDRYCEEYPGQCCVLC